MDSTRQKKTSYTSAIKTLGISKAKHAAHLLIVTGRCRGSCVTFRTPRSLPIASRKKKAAPSYQLGSLSSPPIAARAAQKTCRASRPDAGKGT